VHIVSVAGEWTFISAEWAIRKGIDAWCDWDANQKEPMWPRSQHSCECGYQWRGTHDLINSEDWPSDRYYSTCIRYFQR